MISDYLPALPIIIGLTTAIVAMMAWRNQRLQKLSTIVGCAVLTVVSIVLLLIVSKHGILVCYVSNWKAPYGITLVVDFFSAMMLFLTALSGLCVSIYAAADINRQQIISGFYPAFCLLLTGLNGAFVTGDLFNLYVWFEVSVIASFVLMSCGGSRAQLDGSVRYVVLSLLATLILLTAIALLYGVTGTLNMADIANLLNNTPNSALIKALSLLLILALAMKAALFPLFFWLPASYHTPSFSASAIFAALLSKLGVYSLIRVSTLMFSHNAHLIYNILLVLALCSLLLGIIGANAQFNLRRILSFTLVSHIGYMIVGLSLATPLALAGAIFYLFQHIILKTNLFLISGIVMRYRGSNDIRNIRGLYRQHPYLSLAFFISALALAGIPPLSGFWAKLMLIIAACQQHAYISVVIMLVVSLLTLVVMMKIWQQAFCRENDNKNEKDSLCSSARLISRSDNLLLFSPVCILTLITIAISLYPLPIYQLSQAIVHQLLQPQQYITAVLGG